MRSHNGSIDTTHTPPPLSFYNTFKEPRNRFTAWWAGKTTLFFVVPARYRGWQNRFLGIDFWAL
jgi:hypothetical protein